MSADEVETHLHGYRSPLAAIIGLSEAALARQDLDEALVKQLRAIRALAQDALAAQPRGWAPGREA
jgi:signal transduction histidine kinase